MFVFIVNCIDQLRIDAIHDLENCAEYKQNSAILNKRKNVIEEVIAILGGVGILLGVITIVLILLKILTQ